MSEPAKPINVKKHSVAVWASWEDVFFYASLRDDRYTRKVAEKVVTPVTDEQWAEYERVKAAWEIVRDSEYFDSGCNCEHPSISEPEPSVEYIYAETSDEWLARCKKLHEEGSE